MRLDAKVIAGLAILFEPRAWVRLTPNIHAATPLGMGFGETRFASPRRSFHLLYLAKDLDTGLAEAVIRDRFEAQARREIDQSEIDTWTVAEVSATGPLTVLDLRTTGLLQLGISTDAARAKAQDEGHRLSQAIYDTFDLDGILYRSRLTGVDCLAVYDRAVTAKLAVSSVADLVTLANLVPALSRLNIVLIRSA